jgi:hypothetical protein
MRARRYRPDGSASENSVSIRPLGSPHGLETFAGRAEILTRTRPKYNIANCSHFSNCGQLGRTFELYGSIAIRSPQSCRSLGASPPAFAAMHTVRSSTSMLNDR